ncbi:hypothetical protein [Photobacterium damselae]|uniref:hypothetical protein n=1 Tax=Photobacterium damselae TaxID=38293 RepID=UPI000D65F8FA|nr:hypothetical protein [Photobacterium damselae]AWK83821.1 hypothetical protein BST98_17590 [Photobacterium damselae]
MGIADDTYARISRELYDDWTTRFYPKQVQLLNQAQSGELATQQLNRVDDNLSGSLRSAELANINHMARFGVDPIENSNQEAKNALSVAGAKNAIRANERDRSMSILSGANAGMRSKLNVGG